MAKELVGYGRLIEQYKLPAREQPVISFIDTAVSGRKRETFGSQERLSFEPNYRPEQTLAGNIQFALRYEGVTLEVLGLLFSQTGKKEIEAWFEASPESIYARRAAFLYHWLTDTPIDARVPTKTAYVPLLDERLQIARNGGEKDSRYRVINNLPGNKLFCPLIRKTDFIKEMLAKNLQQRTRETLDKYDSKLLARAAAFLYLKETQSSFDIEREKPSPQKAARFADLLRQAETDVPLSEDRLVALQNTVVDERFREPGYRGAQNWIGKDLGYRVKIDLVPPRPEDVHGLMEGLIKMAETYRHRPGAIDPVAYAASVAFGFVFIHPFMDGNGRLHRYLIHEILSAANFTPKGIVLPVSAVMLANLDQYIDSLESFSKPIMNRTQYDPHRPDLLAQGNDALYFRFFDATVQASFLYRAVERTVEHDLESEIQYLIGYDKAYTELNRMFDWPAHSLDFFIKVVQQNAGTLSKSKRDSHFPLLKASEISEFEAVVRQAFGIAEASPSRIKQAEPGLDLTRKRRPGR